MLAALRLRKWEQLVENCIKTDMSQDVISPKNGGSVKYVTKIEGM